MKNDQSMTIVDLFCGCGGFGLGAHLSGFQSTIAVDVDPILQSAYKQNFPKSKVLNEDLSVTDQDFWEKNLINEEVGGVIGGPPCQGFSRMGKGHASDPRRSLLGHFFRNVNLIKPKFFIMENVEGLMDKKNLPVLHAATQLVDNRYTLLKPFIINASLCGAPTMRKRVIVIGYDKKYIKPLDVEMFTLNKYKTVTVYDAINDLPKPYSASQKVDYGWKEYSKRANLSSYAKLMRSPPVETLGSQEAINKLRSNFVSGCLDTKHSEAVSKRYRDTPQGSTDSISRSKKLDWNGLCPTLRAGTGPDKGSYQAVRPLHPNEGRVITVREAARLQGFPDWFTFHPTKWHSFRMIGNSVSPLVGKHLLSIIKNEILGG